MIADIMATRLYCASLATLGMTDVTRRNLGWRMWWSGPWDAHASRNGHEAGTAQLSLLGEPPVAFAGERLPDAKVMVLRGPGQLSRRVTG